MRASFVPYQLNFKQPSGTSRGVMHHKESYFIKLSEDGKLGFGECGLLRGLSVDDRPDYTQKLAWACDNIHLGEAVLLEHLSDFPSIKFGLEMAFRSLQATNPFVLFPSQFTEGSATIPINGLVWMGSEPFMKQQLEAKIDAGFNCIKMKIGALDFDVEYKLLASIRESFSPSDMEIRVDANGAFSNKEAFQRLEQLAQLSIHSIEQPIKPGNWEEMALLCEKSPLPIALDEELIGINSVTKKENLIQTIKPNYLILKPSLVGGFTATNEWVSLAEKAGIGWWVTSALESNIGLNAIAQFTHTLGNKLHQGLGTGGLYTNNIQAPLWVNNGKLEYKSNGVWGNVAALFNANC